MRCLVRWEHAWGSSSILPGTTERLPGSGEIGHDTLIDPMTLPEQLIKPDDHLFFVVP